MLIIPLVKLISPKPKPATKDHLKSRRERKIAQNAKSSKQSKGASNIANRPKRTTGRQVK